MGAIIPGRLNRPCTITRRSASEERNAFGRQQKGSETVETVCEFQQQGSSEGAVDETVSSSWLGFFPAETEIGPADAVTVPGLGTFEVDGEPNAVRSPFDKRVSHVEVNAQRTGGPGDVEPAGSGGS